MIFVGFFYKLFLPVGDFTKPESVNEATSGNSKKDKGNFFERTIDRISSNLLKDDKVEFICKSFFEKFDDKDLSKNLYFSSVNKETTILSSESLVIGGDNYIICGDMASFNLEPASLKDKLIASTSINQEILIEENTNQSLLEILNGRRENSQYKITLRDYYANQDQSYFLKVNKIKVANPTQNLGSFFNPEIEKMGDGKKIYCSKNLEIDLAYKQYFNENFKDLGKFNLDLNDKNIDRKFRKILANQRHNSILSLVCDDVFLNSLLKTTHHLPKILILKIKIL